MTVWTVLLTRALGGVELDCRRVALLEHCDEVVVVHDGDERAPRSHAQLHAWRAGLVQVPSEVALVTLVDDDGLAGAGTDTVGKMLGALDARMAGIVRGLPVTDALKRVDADEVVSGVDRSGLFVPETPQVVRRQALERVLALPEDAGGDLATRLVGCGLEIGVLWGCPRPDVERAAAVQRIAP